jgi:hypothetical protein
MDFRPHPYQEQAVAFALANPNCYLMLGMGYGKTAVALTVMELAINVLGDCNRVLVVGPKRVAETVWHTEIAKWTHLAPLTVALAIGDRMDRLLALDRNALVTVINRENLPWLVKQYGKAWPFDAVIFDEASGLKDGSSLRVRAMKAIRQRLKRLILLSGTPAPNNLLELHASYFLLDGGVRLHRTLTTYREAFFEPDKRDKYRIYTWKLRPGADQEIYQRISDITFRCEVDLGVREMHVSVPVTIPLRDYRRLERDYLLALQDGTITAANAAVLTGKLLQLSGGAIYGTEGEVIPLHDAKLDRLEELINDAMGQPVLVMYWFKHELARIKARFPLAEVFDGENSLRRWRAGQTPLMLLHPASAGHGVDGLQHGGNIIVWYGPTYSLELFQQANARLARQGQQNTVVVNVLTATGTIDEDVLSLLQTKQASQSNLLEALQRRAA